MIIVTSLSASGQQITSPEGSLRHPLKTIYVKAYEFKSGKNCQKKMNVPGIDEEGRLTSCVQDAAPLPARAKPQSNAIENAAFQKFEDSFFEGLRKRQIEESQCA